MGEGNNIASVCPSIHSGVPTLAGGTYPCFGDLPWGSLYPGLGVPTLARGTYPGKRGVPTLAGGIPTLAWRYLP